MSNMSYCRFHNTLLDLQDCKNALEEYEGSQHDRIRIKAIEAEIKALDNEPESDELMERLDDLEEEKDELENTDGAISDEERSKARQLIDLCREIIEEHESIELE